MGVPLIVTPDWRGVSLAIRVLLRVCFPYFWNSNALCRPQGHVCRNPKDLALPT